MTGEWPFAKPEESSSVQLTHDEITEGAKDGFSIPELQKAKRTRLASQHGVSEDCIEACARWGIDPHEWVSLRAVRSIDDWNRLKGSA